MRGHLGVLALVLFSASGAVADPIAPAKEGEPAPSAVPPPPKKSAPHDDSGITHRGMFEASLRLALGLRAIVPYNKTDYCGDTDSSASSGNAPVCTGRSPFSLDLELGYGATRKIDLFMEAKLGIEADFAASGLTSKGGPHLFMLSPGARFFFSDARHSKLFTTAQLVFDFTAYQDPSSGKSRGADFGVRNLSGVWLDIDQGIGVYAFIGETMTFSRWWLFELEAGAGIQVRYQ
jgi:hypothetical protein